MAKGQASMTCGVCGSAYTATKNCFNRAEATGWEEWMKTQEGLCGTCYKKQKQEERALENAAETAKAIQWAKNIGLPDLEGTEKQVAWAETLRHNLFASVIPNSYQTKFYAGEVLLKGSSAETDLINDTLSFARATTSAKLYIDNRDKSTSFWLDTIYRAIYKATPPSTPDQHLANKNKLVSA